MAKKSKSKGISPGGVIKLVAVTFVLLVILVPTLRYAFVNGVNELVRGLIASACLILLYFFIFKRIKKS
ncbi:MAG: hypothetical protein K0S68_827 [Candidatus Saccharibacteria bacterium]|nr:hypothetical protein [Candidatus Saccharibacteria bacterium]